jgi:aminocarboxymuconate-semialdehyde decarboxylase
VTGAFLISTPSKIILTTLTALKYKYKDTTNIIGGYPMKIDVHSHMITENFFPMLRKDPSKIKARLVQVKELEYLVHDRGFMYPLSNSFYDLPSRLEALAKKQLDMEVLSPSPTLFFYDLEAEVALMAHRLLNDGIAEAVAKYPNNFRGMAVVPMQSPHLAVKELKRVVGKFNFKAVQIGANIEGRQLDEPDYFPFFKTAAEMEVLVFIHPYHLHNKLGLEKYYLTNLVGNPLDTTLAAAHLIFGGVLKQIPGLKICLAHGGGFLPYQLGRLTHGSGVRNEINEHGVGRPGPYMKHFYFDSILYEPEALKFLVKTVGGERVLMGTDYPFDMAEEDPVNYIANAGLKESEKELLWGKNACKIFNLPVTESS